MSEYLGFPYKNVLINAWAENLPNGKFKARAAVIGKYGDGSDEREVYVGGQEFETADEAARHALGHVMNEIDEGGGGIETHGG